MSRQHAPIPQSADVLQKFGGKVGVAIVVDVVCVVVESVVVPGVVVVCT